MSWHSYRASKAALNQVIRCLSIELSAKSPLPIGVGLHPGPVDTARAGPYKSNVPPDKLFTPEQSASRLLAVMDRLEQAQTGRVYDWAGREIDA